MARTKAFLAAGSIGLGAALIFVAATIQCDRFAFTGHGHETRSPDAMTVVAVATPAGPSYVVEPASMIDEASAIRIEALEVKPAVRPQPRAKPSPAREPPKTMAPPCQPSWRELDSGPAGRSVREICLTATEVPRS